MAMAIRYNWLFQCYTFYTWGRNGVTWYLQLAKGHNCGEWGNGMIVSTKYIITILVGGLEHVLFFHILGIIQRGRYSTNQYH